MSGSHFGHAIQVVEVVQFSDGSFPPTGTPAGTQSRNLCE